MPKNKLAKWSVLSIIVMPVLFYIGSLLANSLYKSVPSARTILEDIINRPILALSMLLGMFFGVIAFITGLISLIQEKEKSILVYLSTLIGFLLILFLITEIIFPH